MLRIKRPTLKGTLLFIAVVFILVAVGFFTNKIFGNHAQQDFKPIAAQLKKDKAKFICDNGDGGFGIENTTPWYMVNYYVKASNAISVVKDAAAKANFNLTNDDDTMAQLINLPGYQNNIYLKASQPGKTLKVTIAQQPGEIEEMCQGANHYYDKAAATVNQDAVQFSLTN